MFGCLSTKGNSYIYIRNCNIIEVFFTKKKEKKPNPRSSGHGVGNPIFYNIESKLVLFRPKFGSVCGTITRA